jgi:hypothetical protein
MLRKDFRHGFSDTEWTAAKEEARAAMIKAAKRRAMITYSKLVVQIAAVELQAHDIRLDHLLGEVSSEEHAAGRGLLTVVVVHKTGDMEPGPGFYELAQHLGIKVGSKQKFWIGELHKVHAAWAEG